MSKFDFVHHNPKPKNIESFESIESGHVVSTWTSGKKMFALAVYKDIFFTIKLLGLETIRWLSYVSVTVVSYVFAWRCFLSPPLLAGSIDIYWWLRMRTLIWECAPLGRLEITIVRGSGYTMLHGDGKPQLLEIWRWIGGWDVPKYPNGNISGTRIANYLKSPYILLWYDDREPPYVL